MSIFSEWMGYGLGAYVYHEVDMPTEEMLYLDDVISVTTGWNYDCYSFSKSFGTGDRVFPGGRDFLGVFFERFLDDPLIYINHWSCNTEHLWRLSHNENPSSALWAAMVADIDPETTEFFNLDLRSESKLPELKALLTQYANWSYEDHQVDWQVASLAIGIGSPWVRYSFPTMLVAMVSWPLLFWQPAEEEVEDISISG